jgi:hypothetical protein
MIEEKKTAILEDQKDHKKWQIYLKKKKQNLGTIQEGTFTLDKPHRTEQLTRPAASTDRFASTIKTRLRRLNSHAKVDYQARFSSVRWKV